MRRADHLKAYGLAFRRSSAAAGRSGCSTIAAARSCCPATLPPRATPRSTASPSSRSTTAQLVEIRGEIAGRQHGRGAAGEGAQGRGLRAAQRAAVGRRRHDGAQVRRDRVREDLGRRGASAASSRLRLAAPAPRGLHRPVLQVLPQLRRRALAGRHGRAEPRHGAAARVSRPCRRRRRPWPWRSREFVERGGFLFAMCTATETLELALAGRRAWTSPPRTPTARRWIPTPTRKMQWTRAFAFQRRAAGASRRPCRCIATSTATR